MPKYATTEEQIQAVRDKLTEPGLTEGQVEKFEKILKILEGSDDEAD